MSCEYWDEEKKICGRVNERLVLPLDVNLDEAIKNEEFKLIRFADLPEPKIENRWIPVTERLPEESGDYLVSTIDDEIFILPYDEWQADFGYWYEEFSEETGGKIGEEWRSCTDDKQILAWMPLPEPWKGDGE